MQSVYLLIAIVCNVGAGCVEYAFEDAHYDSYRDCMEAAREAVRDNRHKSGMKNVEFECDRELIRD